MQHRNIGFLVSLPGADRGTDHNKPAPGFYHFPSRAQHLPTRRSEQVYLYLCGQNLGAFGHAGQRRVTCRAVAQRKCQPGMTEPVLLKNMRTDRGQNFNSAPGDIPKFGTKGAHDRLARKACANFPFNLRGQHVNFPITCQVHAVYIEAKDRADIKAQSEIKN